MSLSVDDTRQAKEKFGPEAVVRQCLRPDLFAAIALKSGLATDDVERLIKAWGQGEDLDARVLDAVKEVLGAEQDDVAQRYLRDIVRGDIDENTIRFVDEKLNASRREIAQIHAWNVIAAAIAARLDTAPEGAKRMLVEEMGDGISGKATRVLQEVLGDDALALVRALREAKTVQEAQAAVDTLVARLRDATESE